MKRLITLCIILISFAAKAQTETDTTITETKFKPQFKLSVNYNSSLNYFGRTDSLKSTGLFPMAEFWFARDLYVNAAPVFVSNAAQPFDYAGTVTTLGYLHVTDKMITNLYVMKPFYKQSSQLVQSALKAQSGASLSFLNKVLNVTLGGDVKFSDKMDFGATGGLDHLIKYQMKNQGVLIFDPSVYAYAGTQNFTNTYYKKQPGILIFPGSQQQETKNVQQFNILAYECSLPIIYSKGKWMGLITPSYILPQNLITVEGRPDLSERGKNMFYATISLKRTF